MLRTPLLVPSFSSKGFPEIKKTIAATKEFLTESALISAYDLKHHAISIPVSYPAVLFLDSGGYECSKDAELVRLAIPDPNPREWTKKNHADLIKKYRPRGPTVVISYDHPRRRLPILSQIRTAQDLFEVRPDIIKEILLKAERDGDLLNVPTVIAAVNDLHQFDIVGVTEKELGRSIFERMVSIAKIRTGLERAGVQIPLHVFGSLDTISSPLYFLSGADIFDGLTWLRYTFHEGYTAYVMNSAALRHGIKNPQAMLEARSCLDNLNYLTELGGQMRRYLATADFAEFRFHSEFLRAANTSVLEELGGA